MTHITFASRSAIARFASALTVFALVATPFMTLIPASAHAAAGVSTEPATSITETDATLNAMNNDVAAGDSSFWVSTSTINTAAPSMPPGVYSTQVLGGVSANAPFSVQLSEVATNAHLGNNLPGGIQPNTTYYYVAWVEVGGTWYPGDEETVTTLALPDTTAPSVPVNGQPDATTLGTNSFTFTWDPSTDDGPGPITYEFQSSLNPAQSGGVLTDGLWNSGTLATSSIDSSGAPDGVWYWQVRAKDAADNYSDWSEIWDVTLDTSGDPIPTSETIEITGDTTAVENTIGGWMFGRDLTTWTPFSFLSGNPSIGTGSLYIAPITNTNAGGVPANNPDKDKFIGEYFMQTPIADVESLSYDFKIAAPGDTVEEQFYLNVYMTYGSSSATKYYDCRYDIVPTIGSTAGYTTVTFDPTQPYSVATRAGGDPSPFTCPAIPSDMDLQSAGSKIRAIAINVGDTSASDVGVSGYLDRVVEHIVTDDVDHTTTYDFEPYVEVVETSSVTLCKYADTYPEETPLPGWTLTLTGDTVQDSFAVPVADPAGVNSDPLVAGVSYVATAMGTWLNDRPDDAPEGNDVDAEYSTTDEWVTQMDGYDGFGTNILELEINETDGDWGTYNSSHTYAQAFTVAADGPANFRIFDGDGAHVQQPSWFADNKNSTLEVEISEGYAGVTGENGCVTFEDVPFGSYEVGEVMQDGWENESGLGEVTVDEEEMVFDVVNHNDDFGNDSCMLVSDTTTLEGGTASDLVPEPHHDSWTAVVDMLAMWIWGDEEVTDPTGEETQVFTKTFWLESVPASDATLVIGADNSYEVELNGTPVGSDANEDNYTNAEKDTITIPMANFELGANTLVFTVKNIAFGGGTQETNPAGLIYKLTIPGTECQQTPPDQAELQVHIYKYIQDENDAIALATEGSFPMSATWDAANIGAGSGNYALNAGNSYHAATSPMSQQADYSTYEVTDGNPVMPADSNSCPADKYRLVGYKTGDTLIEAENDAIDDDFPVFDSLDADKYVIVVNEDCDDLDIPPTEQVKVHIYKYLEDENDVATQIPDNAEIAPFAMTATWTADNLNSGTESSGEYVLGNNHGGTSLTYAADTSPMDVGADYTTSEITGENGVLPVGGECVEGAYRLVGYKSGTTLEEAEGGVVTAAAPIFTDLQTDQHVIVVNEDCDDVFDDSTPSEEQFTITSTVEGDGTVTPLGAIVVNEGDNQMFTFTDGGQSLVEVLIDGVDIGSPADYTFSSVNANHTVHARFATNGGGGGGGGGNNNGGQVLGASTDDMCIPLLHTYMRMGIVNDAQEVMDLKGFLNEEMGLTLPIDSNFDAATDAAVRAFQTKYKTEVLDPWTPFGFNDQPTGYVFKLTQWKVNSIHCAPTIYPFPALP